MTELQKKVFDAQKGVNEAKKVMSAAQGNLRKAIAEIIVEKKTVSFVLSEAAQARIDNAKNDAEKKRILLAALESDSLPVDYVSEGNGERRCGLINGVSITDDGLVAVSVINIDKIDKSYEESVIIDNIDDCYPITEFILAMSKK